jgi:hypothetical protein
MWALFGSPAAPTSQFPAIKYHRPQKNKAESK